MDARAGISESPESSGVQGCAVPIFLGRLSAIGRRIPPNSEPISNLIPTPQEGSFHANSHSNAQEDTV